jgi:hypothetical protein
LFHETRCETSFIIRETNWLFREISCFAKQPVLHDSLFLVQSSYLRDNPIFTFMIITTSVTEQHHFYAAPAPIKNFDAALDPAATVQLGKILKKN